MQSLCGEHTGYVRVADLKTIGDQELIRQEIEQNINHDYADDEEVQRTAEQGMRTGLWGKSCWRWLSSRLQRAARMQNFVRAARNRSFLTHAKISYWRDHEERAGTICPFSLCYMRTGRRRGKK